MIRKLYIPSAIVLAAFAIAAGVLFFSDKTATVLAEEPQWTQDSGAGISVPACDASTNSTTCAGGYPVVYVNQDSCAQHPDSSAGGALTTLWGGTWRIYFSGVLGDTSQGTVVGGLECGTSGEWSAAQPRGAGPPASDHVYYWQTGWSGGTFITPVCAPPASPVASCSVSPTTAAIGENVTWSASASGGSRPTKLLAHADEGTGTMLTDNSGYLNNGTINGAGIGWTASSRFGGSALIFGGDGSYVTFGSSPSLNIFGGDFTLEAWVRFADPSDTRALILNRLINDQFFALVRSATNKLAYYHGSNDSNRFVLTGATDLGINTWYHVAVVRSGSTFRLFVNGVLDGSITPAVIGDPWSGLAVKLGAEGIGGEITVPGTIMDEVRISNVARWTSNFTPPTSAYTGQGNYIFSWSGDAPLAGRTGDVTAVSYPTGGSKNGWVSVNGEIPVSCGTVSVGSSPTIDNVTISNPSVIADGSTQYDITVYASDPAGGGNIGTEYAMINRQGVNAGAHRGYLGWSTQGFPYWITLKAGTPIACAGGGSGAINSGGAGWGNQYLNLYACSTSVSGNTRTATFSVAFEPTFTSPTTNNTLSGWTQNNTGQSADFLPFNTFSLTPFPDLTASPVTPVGPLIAGTILTFTSQVNNVGAALAGASTARFCVDDPNCLTVGPGLSEPTIPGITALGNSGPITSAGWTATLGAHTVYFCADVASVVNEGLNEGAVSNCNNSGTFTVGAATLTAEISARQNSGDPWQTGSLTGTAPFNGIDLRTVIGGTAFGTVNYTFYCNNSAVGTGTGPDGPPSTRVAKYDSVTLPALTWTGTASTYPFGMTVVTGGGLTITVTPTGELIINDACSYPTGGIVAQPKVVVERGPSALDHLTTGITVNWPLLSGVSCSVSPATLRVGETATWTANAAGGNGTYTYTWSSNNSEGPSGTQGPTTLTTVTRNVTYTLQGTKTGQVTVSSTGVPSVGPVSCSNNVFVSDLSFNAAPPSIKPGQETTLVWTSTGLNPNSCTLTDNRTPPTPPITGLPTNGDRDIAPLTTTIYTLTCGSSSGPISAQAKVTVANVPGFREVPPQ